MSTYSGQSHRVTTLPFHRPVHSTPKQRLGISIFSYSYTPAHRYNSTLLHQYISILVHRYTNTPRHWCTGIRVSPHTNMAMHRYTSIRHGIGTPGNTITVFQTNTPYTKGVSTYIHMYSYSCTPAHRNSSILF